MPYCFDFQENTRLLLHHVTSTCFFEDSSRADRGEPVYRADARAGDRRKLLRGAVGSQWGFLGGDHDVEKIVRIYGVDELSLIWFVPRLLYFVLC